MARKKRSHDQKRKAKLKARARKQSHPRQVTTNPWYAGNRDDIRRRLDVHPILNFRWDHASIEPLSTHEIVAQFSELGIEFSEAEFSAAVARHFSGEDSAEELFYPQLEDGESNPDADFPWMAADVLWKRLQPDVVSRADIWDASEATEGADRPLPEVCMGLLHVWELLKRRFLADTQDVAVVAQRAGGYYDIEGVLRELIDLLGEAGQADADFLRQRRAYCQEFLELLPASDHAVLEFVSGALDDTRARLAIVEAGETARQ